MRPSSSNILIGAFIILVLLIYASSKWLNGNNNLKCIVSTKNGETYCVRDDKNIHKTANLLAKVADNCTQLVSHLRQKYPDNDLYQRLYERYDNVSFAEILPNMSYTAVTENKSDISLCLTRTKHGQRIIDLNTLMFVALHELSHVACLNEGHGMEFWDTFKKILNESVHLGIYKPVDYSKKQYEYCSMKITDSPLFNV